MSVLSIDFKKDLINIVGEKHVKFDESMAAHTTFRVGGPADALVIPANEQCMIKAMAFCKDAGVPYMIIGNGSNLLVGDKGIRGVVFQLYRTMDDIVMQKKDDDYTYVRAGAGVMLSKLAKAVAAEGLEGFEFASGIPGTFGGAVTMNAGAYGGEIKQSIVSAKVMDEEGNISVIDAADLELGYRTSVIQKRQLVVLEATICLKKGDKDKIFSIIDNLTAQRKEKQPIELPSAGSTFKRPEGYFAGKLIQDAGLKGYRVGGACVSQKHSGFVVNDQNGTAADVMQLIRDVQRIVMEQFGVMLEPEVRIIGEF